jgi:hemoglobin-like flavoprotein
MTPDSLTRLRRSLGELLPHRERFAVRLYDNLFAELPESRMMFSSDLFQQREKLVATLTTVVNNADKLDELDDAIRQLGRHHDEYGVRPEHYVVLRDVLLETIGEELGDAFSPADRNAWTEFYDDVARRMTGI